MTRRRELLGNLLRFGVVGGGTTLTGYLVFTGLLRLGAHYAGASAAAWAVGVTLSYGLNRGFTFAAEGQAHVREFAGYTATYVAQFFLGLAVYAVLMGGFGVKPTPAFLLNLMLTSAFSFIVMRWAVFPWRTAPAFAQAAASEPRSP